MGVDSAAGLEEVDPAGLDTGAPVALGGDRGASAGMGGGSAGLGGASGAPGFSALDGRLYGAAQPWDLWDCQ